MVALVALSLGCIAHGWMSKSSYIFSHGLIAWMAFGGTSAMLAGGQLLIAFILFMKRHSAARSWLLSGLITAAVGPGLCAVARW
ncbi:MAG: hypothetical protein JNL05_02815 [Flavobacteriales bacterium]|nr:hypothetical protein [Flavobacteriales bacterium]